MVEQAATQGGANEFRVLATSGGVHSPEDWAGVSASMLMEALRVNPHSPNRVEIELDKKEAELKIVDLLVPHYRSVRDGERLYLHSGGHRCTDPADLDPHDHTDIRQAVLEVSDVMRPLITNPVLFKDRDLTTNPNMVFDHVMTLIEERLMRDARTIMTDEQDQPIG